MIKRLKRRFIIVNMSILSFVLIGILSSVFIIMYNSEVNVSYQFMESVLNQKNIKEPKPIEEEALSMNCTPNENALISLSYFDFDNNQNSFQFSGNERENNDFIPNDQQFPEENYDDYWYNNDDDWHRPPGEENMPPEDDRDWREPPNGADPLPNENSKPDDSSKNDDFNNSSIDSPEAKPEPETPNKDESNSNDNPEPPKNDKEKTDESSENSSNSESDQTAVSTKIPDKKIKSTSATSAVTKSVSTNNPNKPPEKKEPVDPYKGQVQRTHIFVRFKSPDDIKEIFYKYYDDNYSIKDDEAVSAAVKTIFESKKDRGKITVANQKFRYLMCKSMPFNDYELVLLDRTLEISTVNRLIFTFILIGSLGIIIIFGISIALANWTIKPVDRAWNQQKQFVADASHELKTPLTVISTNTDVILSNPDDLVKNQAKWLNYIKSETIRMSKLVNNMLCIAKYDANRIKLEVNNFNLSNLISSVCLQFENIIFENGKSFEVNISQDVSAKGDEDKIKQLLTILLDNAVKYSSENGSIRVSLVQLSPNKPCIEVSNTSEPISSDQISKIFNRFYRIDDSRNRKTGGSGLGLNIAKTIVEAHHGNITSKYENGIITFTVTF